MRNLFYVCLAMFFIGTPALAQDDPLFNRYLETGLERFFSIKGGIPEGFMVLEIRDPLKVPPFKYRNVEDQRRGQYDFHFLKSFDKECLLLYPIVPHPNFATTNRTPSHQITASLKKILKISPQADSVFVFDNQVTTISGKFVRKAFNADSIHFYEIPLEKPFEKDYIYCTGMVITKVGRASLYFKWYFTEEGKKKEKEYIKQLEGSLWFEEDWRLQIEVDQEL